MTKHLNNYLHGGYDFIIFICLYVVTLDGFDNYYNNGNNNNHTNKL